MWLKLISLFVLSIILRVALAKPMEEWKGLDRMPSNAHIKEILLARVEPHQSLFAGAESEVDTINSDQPELQESSEEEEEKVTASLPVRSWDTGCSIECDQGCNQLCLKRKFETGHCVAVPKCVCECQ